MGILTAKEMDDSWENSWQCAATDAAKAHLLKRESQETKITKELERAMRQVAKLQSRVDALETGSCDVPVAMSR